MTAQKLPPRCYWCGRFGAELTDYRLHSTTPRFVRLLCPLCRGGIEDKRPAVTE